MLLKLKHVSSHTTGAWSTAERVDRLLYRYVADYCSIMTVVPVSALH